MFIDHEQDGFSSYTNDLGEPALSLIKEWNNLVMDMKKYYPEVFGSVEEEEKKIKEAYK